MEVTDIQSVCQRWKDEGGHPRSRLPPQSLGSAPWAESINTHNSHIIASALGGPGALYNIVPLPSNINQSAYKTQIETPLTNLISSKSIDSLIANIHYDGHFESIGLEKLPDLITVQCYHSNQLIDTLSVDIGLEFDKNSIDKSWKKKTS